MVKIFIKGHDGTLLTVPVNPDEIKSNENQKIEVVEVLNLGGTPIPGYSELQTLSWESFLPTLKDGNYISKGMDAKYFIQKLRDLSDGKPVGFKICIGDEEEFIDICKAMVETQIVPDFIAIDGSEGGTGAAPLEFTDNLGMPLYDALTFVTKTLISFKLKRHIRIIVSSKIITGFDILKTIALGADACYSARGMMFALGCIQALQCNEDTCPVGVATQNPKLYKGLDVDNKSVRVAQFHKNTLRATVELMEACGFKTLDDVSADKFFRKVSSLETKSFEKIYFKKEGKLVENHTNFAPPVVYD